MRGLAAEVGRLQDQEIGPLDSALESLEILGVAAQEWERYISATLLALRGWAGMVRQIEARGDRVVHPVPEGSLVEFLAIRLLLDRFAVAYAARSYLGIKTPVREFWRLARGWIDPHWPPSVEQRAFPVFQLAQIAGLSPDVLYRLSKQEWKTILQEIDSFGGLERRRVFHLAYERRFYTQTADAVALHAAHPAPTPARPRFQAIFCIDEREESIRRHVEELAPDSVTYGTAGFFSVAMYYRGVADAHFVPLCPGVIRPGHWVAERVIDTHEQAHQLRQRTRRALGMASYRFNVGSRSLTLGALLTGVVGVLASIPLVARTLFPRFTSRLSSKIGWFVGAPPLTRLQLERTSSTPGPEDGQLGYTVDEMAAIAEKVLRELGLTSGFSRLVFVFGHGSTSMNNPHESAHDCGACGGAGGPERAGPGADAQRRPRPRASGRGTGSSVPAETFFVGGMHNTSNETLAFYDLDLLPESHLERIRVDPAAPRARLRSERPRAEPAVPFRPAVALLRRGSAARRGQGGRPGAGPPRMGARHQRHLHRRPALADPRPLPRPPRVPHLLRSDAGRRREHHPDPDPPGGLSRLRRDQPRILLLLRGQHGLGQRHEAAPQRGRPAGRDGRRRQRPPNGLALADGGDPRAGADHVHRRDDVAAMLRIMERNEGIGKLCRNRWVRLAVLDPATGRALRLPVGGLPAVPAPGRRPAQGALVGGLVSRAGAITWSSRRSTTRGDRAPWTEVRPCSRWNMC